MIISVNQPFWNGFSICYHSLYMEQDRFCDGGFYLVEIFFGNNDGSRNLIVNGSTIIFMIPSNIYFYRYHHFRVLVVFKKGENGYKRKSDFRFTPSSHDNKDINLNVRYNNFIMINAIGTFDR